MRGFLGEFGRKFYGEPESKAKIKVVSNEEMVKSLSLGNEEDQVVPLGEKSRSIIWS